MSWFDTSGLTSLAKNALKEAQKTIDKALDIQHDATTGMPSKKSLTDPTTTPAKEEGDFFSSWGLTASDSVPVPEQDKSSTVITESPAKAAPHTLWGSFTGSFFENALEEKRANEEKDIKSQLEMISDDCSDIGVVEDSFSRSKLVMHGLSEDSEGSTYSRLNSETDRESVIETSKSLPESVCEESFETIKAEYSSPSRGILDSHPVILRRSSDQRLNSSYLNRLSIISSESGKNSSDSIEILSSQSLKTTPDSEGPSMGLKLASSSVEVLPDSLMTPSSVELLGIGTSGGSRTPDDDFQSPMTSPIETNVKTPKNVSTDEDIKILKEAPPNDEEEHSAADDTMSYNSVSEFTAPTILDASLKGKDFTSRKVPTHFNSDLIESFGSDSSSNFPPIDNTPITRAPSRNITRFEVSKHAPESSSNTSLDKSMTDSSNVISIQPSYPSSVSLVSESCASSNEGSWSDRTLNADTDGAVLESSTDEKSIKTSADKGNPTYYIKGLLEDAIGDKISEKVNDPLYCKIPNDAESMSISWKDSVHSGSSQSYEDVTKMANVEHTDTDVLSNMEFSSREQNSPGSSESRSGDMVKIGSGQTSGHTSGDDLETTTSSDIEIIPSPNGDYGSIYSLSSRQSPAKLPNKFGKQSSSVIDLVLGKGIASKIRGHNRELSEVSSQSNTSDDSQCSETDKLMRRLAEMADILECREAKLIEISRNNVELTESNAELKATIETLQGKQDVGDVTLITEEYTQRMSALEKKFQQAIREKDTLRKQMETYKQEAATRMTSGELEKAIGERDETIRELREEGEKLSKQQLHHTTIIKRLRTKEKENEQVIKTLRDKVAEQAQESDRMKRSISAKEMVECSQIEAVYKLTTANKKSEAELADTKSSLDDTNQKLETTQTSLDAAKKELIDLQKNSGDLAKRQEILLNLEKEKSSMESENEQLLHQLEELRIKIRQDEQRWMTREASLRSEVSRQMARAEEAESLLQSSGGVSGGGDGGRDSGLDEAGLLAQIAALQDSSMERERRAQTRERQLLQIVAETQSKLTKTTEANQTLREECQGLRSKVNSLETNFNHVTQKLDTSASACQEHMVHLQISMEAHERLKQEFDSCKREIAYTTNQLHERIRSLDQHLSVEKAACEAEKRRNTLLQEQLREANLALNDSGAPNMLLARLVGDSSTSNNCINQSAMGQDRNDQAPSPHGSVGRDSLASDSIASGMWHLDDGDYSINPGGSDTANNSGTGLVALEQLQAALQRREGELRAARRATRASHAQRAALARELAAHAAELDTMQSLQHQYDALLQMYGEKEEQLQELRLDLQDVKDMYKMQLDEILMLKRQVAQYQNNSK